MGQAFFHQILIDTKNLFLNYALVRKNIKNKLLKTYKINFESDNELIKIIKIIRPQIIIHNAAITNVDYCEVHKKISEKINLKLSKEYLFYVKKKKIKLIFISSDQVFSKK